MTDAELRKIIMRPTPKEVWLSLGKLLKMQADSMKDLNKATIYNHLISYDK